MSVLLDTELGASDIDTGVFHAFLYGQLTGKYTLYSKMDDDKLSIKFDVEEDATHFTLKDLGDVFAKKFMNLETDKEDALQAVYDLLKTSPPIYNPPYQKAYWEKDYLTDKYIIGDFPSPSQTIV